MPDLPSGTVTFLFTDIEGSTKLWEAHPEQMRLSLARHDALLRQAIASANGSIFKTVGDAFCVAFAKATDAVVAVLTAQLALGAESWPEPVSVRVRMALHTGAATERDGDFFGQTVNRVAHLLSLGHGGQTLLSLSTQLLISAALPDRVGLRDLGQHRLKDLTRPEQVFQLLHPDLPSDFRALNSPDVLPNNLPLEITSFIGREKEIAEVKRLLSKTRLLTLTGSGGCGKTRLAIQVAADLLEQFLDGVWLVELAPLADPSLVPQTVASVLGLKEQVGKSYTQSLTEHLKSKTVLLLLDNCEHLLDACAQLSDALLRVCPHMTILASSREGLSMAGEQTYRVPSLSLPPLPSYPSSRKARGDRGVTAQSVSEYEAVRLFVDRAQLSQPTFAVTDLHAFAVASVCRRLDGIPLAIELAAARVRSLPVEEIDTRLDHRFRLLTGGSRTAVPRQQTLRALIDWSYDLLTAQEKMLLCRLSVFAGGWTLTAAESVCMGENSAGENIEDWEVLDLLTSLSDKSLVIAESSDDTTRYRLLETVRQYSLDRLGESEEFMGVRVRHRDYFLTLAETIKPKLMGPEQAHGLSVLEEEHDNLRTALTYCLEDPEGGEAGLQLGASLQRFWETRGHLSEGRERLMALLARPAVQKRTKARADGWSGVGRLARMQGDYAAARAEFEESLEVFRELGDRQGIVGSLNGLGLVASDQGDYAAAHALFEECLAIRRESGDRASIAVSLNNLGIVAQMRSDYASARALYEESLAIHRQLGNRTAEASNLAGLGNVAYYQGDYALARSLYQESLEIRREAGDRWGIAASLNNLGAVATLQGDYASARAVHEECLAIQRELGNRHGVAVCLSNLGNVSCDEGDYALARSLYEESLGIRQELGNRQEIAGAMSNLGSLAYYQGDHASARAVYEECLAIQRELEDRRGIASSLHSLGNVSCDEGDYVLARSLFEESLGIRQELGNRQGIADCLGSFASLAVKAGIGPIAARLWGTASALREATGSRLPPYEREKQEREAAAAREEIGESAFTAAWEEGRALTIEHAVDIALKRTDVSPPG